jgi:transposase
MYVCRVSHDGAIRLHRNLQAAPAPFLRAIAPSRDGLVVAVDCIFTWYWLADLCAAEGIPFVLGQALYRKAIHGGKAKNDQIASHKIAALLRGGMLPQAYGYPAARRAPRDLLRRRTPPMRTRADLLAHVHNTNSQYHLPEIGKNIAYNANRDGVAERCADPAVPKTREGDLALLTSYDQRLSALELSITKTAKQHAANPLYVLQTVPGIGTLRRLVLRYEIHARDRCPRGQDGVSYCRLGQCAQESAGKRGDTAGKKIGQAHLTGAFSEAAALFLRNNPEGHRLLARWRKSLLQAKR